MGLKFVSTAYAQRQPAAELNDVAAFSWLLTARIDTLDGANRQTALYFGDDVLSTGWYFRKAISPTQMQFTVVIGGTYVRNYDTWTVAAGEWHTWAGTWKKNDSAGQKLYRDGSLIDTDSTTSHTTNLNAGSTRLRLATYKPSNEPWQGSIGQVLIWAGVVLTEDQVAALSAGLPWFLAGVPEPTIWYPFFDGATNYAWNRASTAADLDTFSGTVQQTDSGFSLLSLRLWRRFCPSPFGAAATPPPPPPPDFSLWGEVIHPLASAYITGLTNGTTYEFRVTAVDHDGNESSPSSTVEATPSVPPPAISQYRIPWKRTNRRSKYREVQQ